jgi:hypothetical protein
MRVICLAAALFAMWAVVATPATADELPNCALDDVISANSGGLAQIIGQELAPKVRLASVQPGLLTELVLQTAQCCKICRKGKACGNSCIKRSYTCTKPPGCACDGN